MYGAVIGDIIGSVYEFNNLKSKRFHLFHADAAPTDDSVLTAAVAESLLTGADPAATFREWGRRYPDAGYGGHFQHWLRNSRMGPYGSWGNGAAMRVSPVAMVATSDEEALSLVMQVTEPTHGHREGIRGAAAAVHAIRLAMAGQRPADIRQAIVTEFSYDLSASVDAIRPGYAFSEACIDTVPQALTCALEAEDFEDAIRNAVSIGGDTDTVCAIAGPLAEALFGVPEHILAEAVRRMPDDMRDVLERLYGAVGIEPGTRPRRGPTQNP